MDTINPSQGRTHVHSLLWKISLGCFIVAAFTGFLYRLGMIGWLPGYLGLALDNIRHAHSHLMFFGWAVPFPLIILFNDILNKGVRSRDAIIWLKYSLYGALLFGILAYPFFLMYGYRSVQIGAASLPFSVVLSGLVMICWYAYMWGYQKVRNALNKDASQPWFDGALIMLAVSSLGAWGVAVVQAISPESHLLMKALTHFFLATFTEGWVVLILVAILVIQFQPESKTPTNNWLGCIAIGAPLTFPYGISESLLSPLLLIVARIGGGLSAIGLLGVSYGFIPSGQWKNRLWGWVIGLLAFKAVMQLVASIVPSSFWLSNHALRIFYLHVLLLGALTLTMTAWLQSHFTLSFHYFNAVVISVFAVLVSLILPTPFWPQAWGGIWIFKALMTAALLPVLAVIMQWIGITSQKYTS